MPTTCRSLNNSILRKPTNGQTKPSYLLNKTLPCRKQKSDLMSKLLLLLKPRRKHTMPKIRLRTKRRLLKQLANKLSHRRWLKHVLLAGLLGCLPLAASANDAQQQLQHFIENVHSATGEFRQQTFDARRNSATKTQTGTFAFKRPGLFKWHIDTPYEQLVLSDEIGRASS